MIRIATHLSMIDTPFPHQTVPRIGREISSFVPVDSVAVPIAAAEHEIPGRPHDRRTHYVKDVEKRDDSLYCAERVLR